ncbi:putative fumarate reductase flavoprotein subunit [Podospora australis]|uniref:Fumarate reductase n=1 Tax=Podospora australis TaxID=1536484 RepID=A0AAN6WU08_9PEZI|nr:putative fumarate reductase flavoprotein subunit [Podospora australis]
MTKRRIYFLIILSVLIPITAVLYHRFTITTASLTKMASPAKQSVIVVGAGLAGLSASYSALQASAPSVRLLERASKPGGNSIKASSGINGAPTRFQNVEKYGVDDKFLDDTARSAGIRLNSADVSPAVKKQREALISTLTKRSASAIEFLADLGVDLSVVAQLGGHSLPRTHRGAGKTPPGAAIVTTLLGKLKEQEGFELVTDVEVTKLLRDGEAVTGVEYRDRKDESIHKLHGPVVFATGGFAGDTHGLLAKYRPDLDGLPSTNDPRPGAHTVLEEVGAKLVDMDSVQIHPTGFVDPANTEAAVKFLAAEMLRGEGGVLLYKGRRVVNELETRERVSNALMALPRDETSGGGLKQWDVQLLLDPGAAEAAAGHVGFYLWKGLLQKRKIGELDEQTRHTLKEYAAVAAGKKEDVLGRKAFGHWRLTEEDIDNGEQEVLVGRVTPITHFTMGGAVFNEHAQLLASELGGEEEKPIQGLWGAGEITGGLHGDNRLGGSSLLECVVFGRIAGEEAAKMITAAGKEV